MVLASMSLTLSLKGALKSIAKESALSQRHRSLPSPKFFSALRIPPAKWRSLPRILFLPRVYMPLSYPLRALPTTLDALFNASVTRAQSLKVILTMQWTLK